MIGRSRAVCRLCAIYAWQLPWPVVGAQASQFVRLSSTAPPLPAAPGANAAGNAAPGSAVHSSSAAINRAPGTQQEGNSQPPEPPTPQANAAQPQKSRKPRWRGKFRRKRRPAPIRNPYAKLSEPFRGLKPTKEEQKWYLPEDRFQLFAPYFAFQHSIGRRDFRQQVRVYRRWERRYYKAWKRLRRAGWHHPNTPLHEAKGENVEKLKELLRPGSVEGMREFWYSKPKEERESETPGIIFVALNFAPESAVRVLEVIIEEDVTPPYIVPDAVGFLVRWSAMLPKMRGEAHKRAIFGLVLHILRNSKPGSYRFQQWILYDLIANCNLAAMNVLYAELERYRHHLHVFTRLNVAKRFAKHTRYKGRALDILEAIVERGTLSVDSSLCSRLITSIATFPEPDPAGDQWSQMTELARSQAMVFERLLPLGFPPNRISFTAIIRSLCTTWQMERAWRVYDVMRENGIKADPVLLSTLLNGAKLCGHMPSTHRVIDELSPTALMDPYIWNDLLHTIVVAACREAAHKRIRPPFLLPLFPTLLRVYAMFYRLERLQKLIPFDLDSVLAAADQDSDPGDWQWKSDVVAMMRKLPNSKPDQLAEPDVVTLAIMIIGYVKSCSVPSILGFYDRFRALLSNNDEIVLSLLRTNTIPYDAVIKAVTEHKGNLRLGLSILNDMLKSAADSASAAAAAAAAMVEPRPIPLTITSPSSPSPTSSEAAAADAETAAQTQEAPPQQPPPNEASSVPFDHPQPSVYTWSIILRAVSRSTGNAEAAERVLDMMRRRGVEPNLVTWNTLVRGYTNTQRVVKTVLALERLVAAGYQPDSYTQRALASMRYREQALALLERRAQAREEMEKEKDEARQTELDRFLQLERDRALDLEELEELEELGELVEKEKEKQQKLEREQEQKRLAAERLSERMRLKKQLLEAMKEEGYVEGQEDDWKPTDVRPVQEFMEMSKELEDIKSVVVEEKEDPEAVVKEIEMIKVGMATSMSKRAERKRKWLAKLRKWIAAREAREARAAREKERARRSGGKK